MVFDKAYVINVERNIDRFHRVHSDFKRIFPNIDIERVDAIDKNSLTEDFLNKIGVTPSPKWLEPWGSRTFTKGDIACALSHTKAWEKILIDKTEVALLLEDDVILGDGFLDGCLKVESQIGRNFDYVYLARSKVGQSEEESFSEDLVRPSYSYWCLCSLISSSGAEKLRVKEYFQNLIPSDEYMPSRVASSCTSTAQKLFGHLPKLNAYAIRENIAQPQEDAFINSETGKGQPMQLESRRKYINEELKLKICTVATEDNDGLARLRDSAERYGIPLKVLGLEKDWTGGNVPKLENPGGGQKINLLKPYLGQLEDDDILVFIDGYDVVFTGAIEEALRRFNEEFSMDVVFSAEKSCWPDSGLANKYPNTSSEYKFLNSGTFMGKVSELKKITEEPIEDTDDDQLYYTLKLLSGNYSMQLDYECKIFQTIEAATKDLHYRMTEQESEGDLVNTVHKTKPIMVHGNGSFRSKIFFNRLCDYISCNRLGFFQYNPIRKKEHTKEETISIFCFVTTTQELDHFILGLARFNHNNKKISLFVCGNVKFGDKLKEALDSFASIKIKRVEPSYKEMEAALRYAHELRSDYLIITKTNSIISNPYMLQKLIESDKKIIAPKLKLKGDSLYANFWRDIDDNGWYLEAEDYSDIALDKTKGVWNSPHVSDFILIRRDAIKSCFSMFENGYTHERGDFITFCANLRNAGFFVYVDNQENYGYLCEE